MRNSEESSIILEKEQIHRYMRHIMVSEVSGPRTEKAAGIYNIYLGRVGRRQRAMVYYLV